MKTTVQNEKKAVELRREGKSYSDIAKQLKVSRSSVCNWVKNVRLTEAEKLLLHKNIEAKKGRGRMMASMTIRTRKVYKEKVAYDEAEREFTKLSKDPFFMFVLGLTGPEKSKKGYSTFQFTTSDPRNMKLIMKWLRKYLKVGDSSIHFRLSVAATHKHSDLEAFWMKNVPFSRESLHKTVVLKQKKGETDREYHGSLSLFLSRIEPIRKIIAWQKLTMLYYS
jgi:predicted transcriptional regulator